MKLTKEQAAEKYPGGKFCGEGVYYIDLDAVVGSGTRIESGVVIESGAHIEYDTFIGASVHIKSDAVIGASALIGSGAHIGSDAFIGSGVVIGSEAVIGSGAVIEPGVYVGSGVTIRSGACISPAAVIESGAYIGSGRKGVKNALVLNGLGETKQMTAHDSSNGLIIVIGCLNDHKGVSLEEAKTAISKKYPDSHPYFAALKLAQTWYESL